jgi:hypothetical protein
VRIGRLIPGIIVLGLVLDAATHLIPLDRFSFRAWETLAVGAGRTGPFVPDRVYDNPRSSGDLARLPRYRHLREHRLEYFSTDAWGFRNTVPSSTDRRVSWLLVGDSFGVGSGVTDGGTLASQVARLSGEGVYNASAHAALSLRDIQFTSDRLGMTQGRVIYEFMERQTMPTVAAAGDARHFTEGPPRRRPESERYRVAIRNARIGRLNILAKWGWEALATAVGLPPTPQFAWLTIANLANGQPMLFFGGDVAVSSDGNRTLSADYLVWLRSQLAKRNLELVVLLVPTKYAVYGPLLEDPPAVPASDLPLRRLAERLEAENVFVVNTTAALRKQAADGLSRNEYNYFIDDTHWNERGIRVAAQALMDAWTARSPSIIASDHPARPEDQRGAPSPGARPPR